MAYLDYEGLAYYDGKLKQEIEAGGAAVLAQSYITDSDGTQYKVSCSVVDGHLVETFTEVT